MPPTDTDPLSPVQRRALELDAALVRLARSQGAVELAVAETLLQLFEGDRLLRLGFARRSDYAREKLGVPARTMYQWARLARALRERPVLRAAVMTGFVTPAKHERASHVPANPAPPLREPGEPPALSRGSGAQRAPKGGGSEA